MAQDVFLHPVLYAPSSMPAFKAVGDALGKQGDLLLSPSKAMALHVHPKAYECLQVKEMQQSSGSFRIAKGVKNKVFDYVRRPA